MGFSHRQVRELCKGGFSPAVSFVEPMKQALFRKAKIAIQGDSPADYDVRSFCYTPEKASGSPGQGPEDDF